MPTEDAPDSGLLKRLLDRIGRPLSWSPVDKCLFIVAIAVPVFFTSYLLNAYIVANPTMAPYYNFDFLDFFLKWHWFVIGGWGTVGIAGLAIRRSHPESKPYVYLASQFGAITVAVFMYFAGYFTTPYLTVVLGAGTMVLVYFDLRTALWALASLLAVYLGLSAAIWQDLIPGAPLLASAPYDGKNLADWWVLANTGICTILMIYTFGLTGFAIHQWRDREAKLDELSRTDALTLLSNRRHFFEMLHAETARARRHGRPLSLLLCDADEFKEINDTYGHQAGDAVLRKIADILQASCRLGTDVVGRIGGDEFALLLGETSAAGAKLLATRIIEAVRRESFIRGGRQFSISLSIGVAVRELEDFDVDEFVEVADTLLYRAKNAGRNRMVMATLAEFYESDRRAAAGS